MKGLPRSGQGTRGSPASTGQVQRRVDEQPRTRRATTARGWRRAPGAVITGKATRVEVARPTGVRSVGPGPVLPLCSAQAGRRPHRGLRGSLPPATSPGRLGGGLSHPATCIGTPLVSRLTSQPYESAWSALRPSPHPARGGTPLRRGRASSVAVVHPRPLGLGAYRDRRPRVGPARSLFSYQGTVLPWPAPAGIDFRTHLCRSEQPEEGASVSLPLLSVATCST